MLYDPKWNKKDRVHESGVSLRGLISWLEKQPPDQRYEFCDPRVCALGQYRQSEGASLSESIISFGAADDWLQEVVQGDGLPGEWTFGLCLERARAALSEQSTGNITGPGEPAKAG